MLNMLGLLMVLLVSAVVFGMTAQAEGIIGAVKIWSFSAIGATLLCVGVALLVAS